MTRKSCFLEIFLISFAALLLEISYTRVFSFKLSSYFTYLIIGFAMLGMGSGSVLVAISERLRGVAYDRLLPLLSLVGSVTIGLGYFVIVVVEVSTHEPPTTVSEILRLTLICFALFAGFLVIGVMVARIFTLAIDRFNRLYFADLSGAALGCAAAVPLMLAMSPPGCVFVAAAVVAASGLRLSGGSRGLRAGLVVLVVAFGSISLAHDSLPDPVVDPVKSMGRENIKGWGLTNVFRQWHPIFRVDVADTSVLGKHQKWLIHDGQQGSVLWEFDGDLKAAGRFFSDLDRTIPFAVIRKHPRVLIIGAAGGIEIVAALHFEAESVTAVELNPVTVSIMREHFADYTGHLADYENVTVINDEGRSFLHRDEEKYDLIYFVAPDSYASMNAAQASGFVLVEGYLYTKEAIQEAFRHLAPGGVLCMQFGEVDYEFNPNRTARYLSTARAALEDLGLNPFKARVMLATNKSFPFHSSTILLRKEAWSKTEIDALYGIAETRDELRIRYAPGRPGDNHSVPWGVINLSSMNLLKLFDRYAFDISPVFDEKPFFWHFARWRHFFGFGVAPLRNPMDPTHGRGEASLLVMLAICVFFAAGALLLPFAAIRERWQALPKKGWTALYFASLGLGFMAFEIPMIQKLTLFLGYPTYSLTVTLFGLLIFSGIGSLLSERYKQHGSRALVVLTAGIVAIAIFSRTGLDPLLDSIFGLPLAARVAVVLLWLAPMGICLGAYMPVGLAVVTRIGGEQHAAEYVAWAWAINGFFSVIGSMLVTIFAMTYGFPTVLLGATLLYIFAALVLSRIDATSAG